MLRDRNIYPSIQLSKVYLLFQNITLYQYKILNKWITTLAEMYGRITLAEMYGRIYCLIDMFR